LTPTAHDLAAADRLGGGVKRAIDDIVSLDQDRILRNCLIVIRAMVRTNYFQRSSEGQPKAQLAFKLDSSLMPFLPFPRPRFEIFVYSPRVEGVHLRGCAPARRESRARGDPLVGPARGLPHGGPRVDEGADGQERRHCSGSARRADS